jgi:hypothetical protein
MQDMARSDMVDLMDLLGALKRSVGNAADG